MRLFNVSFIKFGVPMKNTLLLIALLSSFSCICPAQIGLTWQYAGSDNIPGRVTSILVDKRDVTGQTVYIGTTGGGIWKSTNGTNTWTRLEHNVNGRSEEHTSELQSRGLISHAVF